MSLSFSHSLSSAAAAAAAFAVVSPNWTQNAGFSLNRARLARASRVAQIFRRQRSVSIVGCTGAQLISERWETEEDSYLSARTNEQLIGSTHLVSRRASRADRRQLERLPSCATVCLDASGQRALIASWRPAASISSPSSLCAAVRLQSAAARRGEERARGKKPKDSAAADDNC